MKQIWKQFLCLMLVAVLMLALCACSEEEQKEIGDIMTEQIVKETTKSDDSEIPVPTAEPQEVLGTPISFTVDKDCKQTDSFDAAAIAETLKIEYLGQIAGYDFSGYEAEFGYNFWKCENPSDEYIYVVLHCYFNGTESSAGTFVAPKSCAIMGKLAVQEFPSSECEYEVLVKQYSDEELQKDCSDLLKYNVATNKKGQTYLNVENTSDVDIANRFYILFLQDGRPVACEQVNAKHKETATCLRAGKSGSSKIHVTDEYDACVIWLEYAIED